MSAIAMFSVSPSFTCLLSILAVMEVFSEFIRTVLRYRYVGYTLTYDRVGCSAIVAYALTFENANVKTFVITIVDVGLNALRLECSDAEVSV